MSNLTKVWIRSPRSKNIQEKIPRKISTSAVNPEQSLLILLSHFQIKHWKVIPFVLKKAQMKEAIRFFYSMKIAKITKSIDYSTMREEKEIHKKKKRDQKISQRLACHSMLYIHFICSHEWTKINEEKIEWKFFFRVTQNSGFHLHRTSHYCWGTWLACEILFYSPFIYFELKGKRICVKRQKLKQQKSE